MTDNEKVWFVGTVPADWDRRGEIEWNPATIAEAVATAEKIVEARNTTAASQGLSRDRMTRIRLVIDETALHDAYTGSAEPHMSADTRAALEAVIRKGRSARVIVETR